MTALVSVFARAYHTKHAKTKVFNDSLAFDILGYDYELIAQNIVQSISFFDSKFKGSEEEALNYIVHTTLAPATLARSYFTEVRLKNEIMLGCKQYLILASGYDSFAFRLSNKDMKLKIFEIDKKEMIQDKLKRLKHLPVPENVKLIEADLCLDDWSSLLKKQNFKTNTKTFCSILGLTYYLNKQDFFHIIDNLSENMTEGSALVFDYPVEGEQTKTQELLNDQNGKTTYTYQEIVAHLAKNDFLIYEHLTSEDINQSIFRDFNVTNSYNLMIYNTNFCYAIKKK